MKQRIKVIISAFLLYSGLFYVVRLLWNMMGKRLTVLTFHRVSEKNGLPSIRISPQNFERLLHFVEKRYNVISLTEYLEIIGQDKTLPFNSILMTFDDGYRELMETALPVLQRKGVSPVLFLPSGLLESKGVFWWDTLFDYLADETASLQVAPERLGAVTAPFFLKNLEKLHGLRGKERQSVILSFIERLQNCNPEIRERVIAALLSRKTDNGQAEIVTWEDVKQLHRNGVEIGSHTVSHEFLSSVEGQESMEEVTRSKSQLEAHLKQPVVSFSYPGGKYSEDTPKLVAAAGYACAFTTDEGLNSASSDPYTLRRINISDDNVCAPNGDFSSAMTAWHLFFRQIRNG